MQQAFNAPRAFNTTFRIDSLGRIYASVGYDIRAGMLRLSLVNNIGGRWVSTAARDSHVLVRHSFIDHDSMSSRPNIACACNTSSFKVVENLPPALYTLTVSESALQQAETLTCLRFTLEMVLESDDNAIFEEAAANELPSSLDSVAFLGYSTYVHFAGIALFPRSSAGLPNRAITFQLAERSIVRVLVQRVASIGIRVLFGAWF